SQLLYQLSYTPIRPGGARQGRGTYSKFPRTQAALATLFSESRAGRFSLCRGMVYGKFTDPPVKPAAMRRRPALFASLGLAALLPAVLAPAAGAGDALFLVVNAKGKPVMDAVITAYPAGLKADQIRFSWPQEMDQHNLEFDPFVLIVPVGASVS